MTPKKKSRPVTSRLKVLSRKRATILGSANLIKSFNQNFQPEQGPQVRVRLELLDDLWKQFSEVQDEIESLEVVNEDDDLELSEERIAFHNMYVELKSSLISKLPGENVRNFPRDPPNPGPVAQSVRLPEIKIPEFNGNPEDWIEFRDVFKSLVHGNLQLTAVQKLHYLKASLKSEALRIVSSLEMSADNYLIAWRSLEKRYNNPNLLIKRHLAALFSIPPLKRESATSLSELVDQFDRHVSILNQLEGMEQHWNSVLVEGLSRRLDSNTLREWENHCDEEQRPTYDELIAFIRKQARTLQSVKLSQVNPTAQEVKPVQKLKSSTFVISEPSNKCPVCKQGHPIYRCDQFKRLSPKERFNVAKRHKLCINCLNGFHLAKNCNSIGCSVCTNRHHTLLHLPPTSGSASNTGGSTANTFMITDHSRQDESELPHSAIQQHPYQSYQLPSVASRASMPSLSPTLSSLLVPHVSEDSVSKTPLVEPTQTIEPVTNSYKTHPLRDGCEVFLATSVIKLKDVSGSSRFARVVLDNCSQCNFISEPLARNLGLKRVKTNMDVVGIGQGKVHITEMVDVQVFSRVNRFSIVIKCLIITKIPAVLPSKNINISDWNIPRKLVLADPKFNISAGVDLLIGAEFFFRLIENDKYHMADGYPSLQRTVFGYIVSGMYAAPRTNPSICIVSTGENLDGMLQRFWDLERINESPMLTPDEQRCEDHFRRTVSRDQTGRYVVRLPLREDRLPFLGDSYQQAQRRFLTTERRFQADPNFRDAYFQFMDEYARLGHMEPSRPTGNLQFYLPHHAIYRPDSSTTKTRIVFDASCRGGNQLALNDVLYTGPTVQSTLLSIVCNYRIPKFVFKADVEKMFRQIWTHPFDRSLLQVFWRRHQNEPLLKFNLTTVTYGTACAPFQATRVLLQLADDEGHRFPLGACILRKGTYMDDTLAGGDDLDEVIQATIELKQLLAAGGFNLRKWCANDSRVLSQIPPNLVEMPEKVELDHDASVKTLGLFWNPHTDTFSIKIPSLSNTDVITKRVVVSEMAQLFDPLGLVGPVVAAAKMFVQKLWGANLSWDDPLSTELTAWWQQYRNQLPELQNVEVPRRVLVSRNYSLHCFCDASARGYGSCVYVVSVDESGKQHSNLLISKSRVAPIKNLSIPRLELCGALLGCQLVDQLLTTTDYRGSVTFWTDSTVVLHWISSPPSTWKIFVSNRIAEVQRLSKGHVWRHVQSENNPADHVSRGLYPTEIVKNELWWHGPSYLTQSTEFWPKSIGGSISKELLSLEGKTISSLLTVGETPWDIFDRFSDLSKLVKVTAWCYRFYNNARHNKGHRMVGNLTTAEFNGALKSLIGVAQVQSFPTEIKELEKSKGDDCTSAEMNFKSLIKGLNVYLHEDKLLRIKGRLVKLSAPIDTRCPILMSGEHRLTKLIARSIHLQTMHGGPTLLLSTMRQRYWPIRGRNLARKIVGECVQCFRCSPHTSRQIMAPLPEVRITPARVFSNCGLDYCGPFLVRPLVGRGTSVKVYVACFVCMVSKAIHLEVVYDLSSQSCINALKRFIARRGRLVNLYCDNATTFVGANRELKELRAKFLQQFQSEIWNNYCIKQGITFNFIPARSPHFGGLWEAGVKSFKHHFRRVFGLKSLRLDEMTTVITQIEAILNSRPLTPLSNDPKDLTALTPGHLLIGEPMFSIPEPDVTDTNVNRLNRLQDMRRSIQDFWRRWARDYISQLHQRSKWQTVVQRDLHQGALVLLKQDNLPPLQWNTGRIVEMYPGTDGHVRVVHVQTSRGLFKRAITEVCLLPIDVPQKIEREDNKEVRMEFDERFQERQSNHQKPQKAPVRDNCMKK